LSWFHRQTRPPIGLDIGSRCIKAVQLGGAVGAWQIQAAVILLRTRPDTPIDRQEVHELKRNLGQNGFADRDVVLAVPTDKLLAGVMELPPRQEGVPLDQIAQVELARMNQCDPQSLEMAYWELPTPARGKQMSHVMAAACRHKDAENLLDAFEGQGLEVRGLDVAAWALARVCRSAVTDPQCIGVVLDVGWDSARLVFTYQDTVIYERVLGEAGVRTLSQALFNRLGLEQTATDELIHQVGFEAELAEQKADQVRIRYAIQLTSDHFLTMAEELRASFNYAVQRYRGAVVDRLLLVGGGASIPGLVGFLSKTLDLQVTPVTGGVVKDCDLGTEDPATAAFAMAIGLAQYENSMP